MKALITSERYRIVKELIRWSLLILPVAVAIGSMVALFLWILDLAIIYRFHHPWLLFLLPLAGVLIHLIYRSVGRSSEKGNNLIMDEIHEPGGGVPPQMSPIILLTTVLTHLFGGSAGREGTAVQIGGSIAHLFGKWYRLSVQDMQLLLTSGVAAGFGAVFGTPLTGALFALEVLAIGRMQYNALLPALIGAVAGDYTVAAWGVHHTAYQISAFRHEPYFLSAYLPFDGLLMVKVMLASAAFGMSSALFSSLVHAIKVVSGHFIRSKWLIPFTGGLVIIALTYLNGKPDYLSLGVAAEYPGAVTIQSAFHAGGADLFSWFWKMIYTAITLGSGFKGGEVTPLFYIGATLGNTLSAVLHAPVGLFAALGFIAVFAGATNTPLACTVMGVELFGGEHVLYYAIACFTAYLFSGHSGIYSAQRIAIPKLLNAGITPDSALGDLGKSRPHWYERFLKH
ncbi:voltage-gated chloride channel family protein [Mucilaginibacter daejeonensis]|uniref:voltage-gated chloride channel family protein n=1 Tax=Mucilaginibacter daejeonensis TaxID=398049 RepID=UPI001D178A5F|nr:voltage-gated chloride channel family protein [Mucilaginibacter daejeonensis]UEG51856.1 voltage-gated chloride channel family protein [Mucilaginibacter daejeonensis]